MLGVLTDLFIKKQITMLGVLTDLYIKKQRERGREVLLLREGKRKKKRERGQRPLWKKGKDKE